MAKCKSIKSSHMIAHSNQSVDESINMLLAMRWGDNHTQASEVLFYRRKDDALNSVTVRDRPGAVNRMGNGFCYESA